MLEHYTAQYRDTLLHDVAPFWMKHSLDPTYGGYFTCLDRSGQIYDTDKFIWLQARQIWTFSMLYNQVEKHPDWLSFAEAGAGFLKSHGRAPDGSWYFSTTREGRPLVQPYNIFSDCFASMAFGQLSKATQNAEYAEIAVATFQNILKRRHTSKGQWNKMVTGTRPLKNFALPMILCNLALEIEHLLDKNLVEEIIAACLHEVMEVFYQPDTGLILENVTPQGGFSDSFEGRLLNPGHAIEAMWFVMDLATKIGDRSLIERAVKITLSTLDYGWDREFGGIYYFLDIKGAPPQQLEWNQKLWWVHLETLVALSKAYYHTQSTQCRDWFDKVHTYTWTHFPDPESGEWFGYLDRQGQVLLPLKGGKWKGCFHVPRGLYQCWRTLEKIQSTPMERILNDRMSS